jgi:hypothetical protein|tara:strand:- start:171 stop:440 length:270 start_codon:yes stop_codon:yes gene_type:complete
MSEEQVNSMSKDGLTTLMIDVDHQCVKCHNAIELLRKMPDSSPHDHPNWTFRLIPSWTANEHTGHTGFTHYHIEIIVPTIKDKDERFDQ